MILLVETCTNLVAKEVAGRWGYAAGGRKSSIAADVGWSISLSHGSFWYTRDCDAEEGGENSVARRRARGSRARLGLSAAMLFFARDRHLERARTSTWRTVVAV